MLWLHISWRHISWGLFLWCHNSWCMMHDFITIHLTSWWTGSGCGILLSAVIFHLGFLWILIIWEGYGKGCCWGDMTLLCTANKVNWFIFHFFSSEEKMFFLNSTFLQVKNSYDWKDIERTILNGQNKLGLSCAKIRANLEFSVLVVFGFIRLDW